MLDIGDEIKLHRYCEQLITLKFKMCRTIRVDVLTQNRISLFLLFTMNFIDY